MANRFIQRRRLHGEHVQGRYGPSQRVLQWASVVLAIAAISALSSALVMAPPRSGPFCQEADCVAYPYTDAAGYVPNDYIWMYPAILMCLAFFVWVVAVMAHRAAHGSVAGTVAIGLTGMSVITLLLAYGIQLLVMQPALLLGETDSLSAWSQYNPHGLFIALESAGNWLAGLSLIVLAVAPAAPGSPLRWIQRLSMVSGIVIVGLLPTLAAIYRTDLAYRFEVFSISVLWPTLAIFGTLDVFVKPDSPGNR